jgi:hypothetical protein
MSNSFNIIPTLDGITNISADSITTDSIETNTINVTDEITTNKLKATGDITQTGGILSIPSFPNVGNTLNDHEQRLTGITYDPNTNTTTFAYPDVNGNAYNIYVPNANMIIDAGTLTLNNNFYVSQIDVTIGMFMDNNAGITFASGSTGIIDQVAPYNGTNNLKATNFKGNLMFQAILQQQAHYQYPIILMLKLP